MRPKLKLKDAIRRFSHVGHKYGTFGHHSEDCCEVGKVTTTKATIKEQNHHVPYCVVHATPVVRYVSYKYNVLQSKLVHSTPIETDRFVCGRGRREREVQESPPHLRSNTPSSSSSPIFLIGTYWSPSLVPEEEGGEGQPWQ